MKEDKMALKRALNEYKGKQDYERLLTNYTRLSQSHAQLKRRFKNLDDELVRTEARLCRCVAAIVALGTLLLVAAGAIAWLWIN